MKLEGLLLAACAALMCPGSSALAGNALHTTWLWHLHQPIYWPDRRASGNDHYETAWDTIQQQDSGRAHPTPEVLRNIFGLEDRVHAYQGRPRDTLAGIASHLKSGAQVSYSGADRKSTRLNSSHSQISYA